MNKSFFKIMLSPWAILVAVIVGISIGIYSKLLASHLAPLGKMYLTFLQMCVIPILISAVTSSLGKLMSSEGVKDTLSRMVIVFVLGLLLTSGIGVMVGVIGKPGGNLDAQTRNSLGEAVKSSKISTDMEIALSKDIEPKKEPSLSDFFLNMIPKNVFESLTNAQTLSLIFFSIVFGVAVGSASPPASETLLTFMESVYKVFQWLIAKAMYMLPVGLACLLADQISRVGVDILLAMIKLIVLFYLAGVVMLFINFLIIWRRSKQELFYSIRVQLNPIIVAVGTLSSLASIPAAINTLHDKLRFSASGTNLFLPLGIVLCRYGNVLYFALATLFIAQLYDTTLTVTSTVIVVIGVALSGMATSGSSGILTLSMLNIILVPLGLPLEAALVLFIAIDPIIDPMRTLLIVHCNMAATTLIAPLETSGSSQQESEENVEESTSAHPPLETNLVPQ